MNEMQRPSGPNRRVSVAPMMDWTDRHCRYFLRLITRRALLYTEMITTSAILHGDRERLLAFDPAEHPLALQLGGSEPAALAACAKLAEDFGYDEVNLNLGCPSDRVQSAKFGVCLMAEPALVAEGVSAMIAATRLPVTIKTRIGVDERDSYGELLAFVRRIADVGCRSFAIHARKAWLQGLSPKENREIPPLRWDVVHRLKADNPDLEIVLNGGVEHLDQVETQLCLVDGVMIGRAAYRDPYILRSVDRRFFGDLAPMQSRRDIVERLLPYVERCRARGVPVKSITRHILGLFQGVPGARAWRRHLSTEAHRDGAGPEVIRAALSSIANEACIVTPSAAAEAREVSTAA
ncbi:MAG TPA: tRNA dihydrouridine(20/20a) synthase DusA [Alphaproteobacteria bacterium]